MKTRLLLLIIIMLPLLSRAQFSSAQRQVQMSNTMFAQQNRMTMLFQQQQRIMASLTYNVQTAEIKMAKEEKKLLKTTKKRQKLQELMETKQAELSTLKNASDAADQSELNNLNSHLEKDKRKLDKMNAKQAETTKRIESYKEEINKNNIEREALAKKVEEEKKAKAAKKAASKKEKTVSN
ncbi:hypothetical protein FFWV33_02020 [Flavobacterium faecale]|uniref:Peptidase M23 n=1 Tax=Flavobacterium faecale TaxID=1355330 RepID=A0A2S1L9M3_9FLAO|nr:hypothetical protein [Flavobacterium faecale]AWG20388.1 hypothetical protein FFWV33_02020 [Flavobacterium faecale]